jgi:hypothetical protein
LPEEEKNAASIFDAYSRFDSRESQRLGKKYRKVACRALEIAANA